MSVAGKTSHNNMALGKHFTLTQVEGGTHNGTQASVIVKLLFTFLTITRRPFRALYAWFALKKTRPTEAVPIQWWDRSAQRLLFSAELDWPAPKYPVSGCKLFFCRTTFCNEVTETGNRCSTKTPPH